MASTMPQLPIIEHLPAIADSLDDHPVVIVQAETGSGKTTQIPPYLQALGYRVLVTQPRRLAAKTIAAFVAQNMGVELGTTVGYRVGRGEHVDQGPHTDILFVTDGLGVRRQLGGHNGQFDVIFVDEVHEFNEAQEVMLWYLREQIRNGATFKVVLSSATLEAARLSEYFDDAPILQVPGRLFPVEERSRGASIEADVARLVQDGRNVLVFMPGVKEITDTIQYLEDLNVNAVILPLHGELSKEEQAKCFEHYGKPKVVVATNVAQTSITIDDIDAVVDSGLARVKQATGHADSLVTVFISQAERLQRMGRAGRTKHGIYIDHCPASAAYRDEFPLAEVQRIRLDRLTLRLLAEFNIDIEQAEFLHQPDSEAIQAAKFTLRALGFLDEDGTVTDSGKAASKLDVAPYVARMVLEAKTHHVVGLVIIAAALLENKSIVKREKGRFAINHLRYLVPDERSSDLIAMLQAFLKAQKLSDKERNAQGFDPKTLRFVREAVKDLQVHLKLSLKADAEARGSDELPDPTDPAVREAILKSVAAGMIEQFYYLSGSSARDVNGAYWQLAKESIVEADEVCWIMAKGFTLNIGDRPLHLLSHVSIIDVQWLIEVAPHLVRVTTDDRPVYDPEADEVFQISRVLFNGIEIQSTRQPAPDHPDAPLVFARKLAGMHWHADHAALDAVLHHNWSLMRYGLHLFKRCQADGAPIWNIDQLAEHYLAATGGTVTRCKDLPQAEQLRLPDIDPDYASKVMADYPDTFVRGELVFSLRYEAGQSPMATVSYVPRTFWQSMPDRPLQLRNGTPIEVTVHGYNWTTTSTDGSELRRQVLEHELESQWQQFVRFPNSPGLRGIIHHPDASDLEDVKDAYEHDYGTHPVTGEALTAYGFYRLRASWLELVWTRDITEAIQGRNHVVTQLQDRLGLNRQQELLQRAGALLRQRQAELAALQHDVDYVRLPQDLRDDVNHILQRVTFGTVKGYADYGGQVSGVIAQVQAALLALKPAVTAAPANGTDGQSQPADGADERVQDLRRRFDQLTARFNRR